MGSHACGWSGFHLGGAPESNVRKESSTGTNLLALNCSGTWELFHKLAVYLYMPINRQHWTVLCMSARERSSRKWPSKGKMAPEGARSGTCLEVSLLQMPSSWVSVAGESSAMTKTALWAWVMLEKGNSWVAAMRSASASSVDYMGRKRSLGVFLRTCSCHLGCVHGSQLLCQATTIRVGFAAPTLQ